MAASHFLKAAVFSRSDEQPRVEIAIRDAKNVRHALILPRTLFPIFRSGRLLVLGLLALFLGNDQFGRRHRANAFASQPPDLGWDIVALDFFPLRHPILLSYTLAGS